MTHALETVMRDADGFVLIGDSSQGRFPGFSYAAYSKQKRRFYCIDLGGLSASRGPVKGGKVYASAAELPEERGDLAILWVKPGNARAAVDVANEARCTRIWFSFKTGHANAVAHAKELGMDVVEVGRCPVYYMEGAPMGCRAHTALVKVSGTWARPPATDADPKRRELV